MTHSHCILCRDKWKRLKLDCDNDGVSEDAKITADSTFKPKSLKNQARAIETIAKDRVGFGPRVS